MDDDGELWYIRYYALIIHKSKYLPQFLSSINLLSFITPCFLPSFIPHSHIVLSFPPLFLFSSLHFTYPFISSPSYLPDIAISFESSSYTVNETDFALRIRVLKEPRGKAETEITYTFSVQAITSPTAGQATADEDFIFISSGTISSMHDITTDQQSFDLRITLIDDGVPEGAETFQVLLSNVQDRPQFRLGTYSSVTVTILDDDSKLITREGRKELHRGKVKEEGKKLRR